MIDLSAILASPLVEGFDRRVDRLADGLRGSETADRVMYGISEAANHSILWHSINAVDALVGGPAHRRPALRRSIILATEQALVNGAVKAVFRRDRPTPAMESPHRLRKPRTSSFPSGHASAGACAATLLSEDLGMAPLWWATAAVVSWSRVHVSVHHGSDIVGGLIVGRALGVAASRVWPDSRRPAGPVDPSDRSSGVPSQGFYR